MTPPPNIGCIWVIFQGWSQILPGTKLFRHEIEQNCSSRATQELEEKVQQHNEDLESSKTGCKSPSRTQISKIPRPSGRSSRTYHHSHHFDSFCGGHLIFAYVCSTGDLLLKWLIPKKRWGLVRCQKGTQEAEPSC